MQVEMIILKKTQGILRDRSIGVFPPPNAARVTLSLSRTRWHIGWESEHPVEPICFFTEDGFNFFIYALSPSGLET